MGTWMGLCCLLVTRSSFSSNDLHVASRACSLASMLSSRKQIVWLMEYRNDCKRREEPAQKGCRATGDSGTDPALGPGSQQCPLEQMGPCPGLLCFQGRQVRRTGAARRPRG